MVNKPWKIIGDENNQIKIYGNNHEVPVIYGWQLNDKEKKEFDYMDKETLECSNFFRYKGWTYYLGDFECEPKLSPFYGIFDGHVSDTFFSGVGVKYPENTGEVVKVYTYYS